VVVQVPFFESEQPPRLRRFGCSAHYSYWRRHPSWPGGAIRPNTSQQFDSLLAFVCASDTSQPFGKLFEFLVSETSPAFAHIHRKHAPSLCCTS
jgi:hypothetical protein